MRILPFLLIFSFEGFSQSLTIGETINYLNQISKEHPYVFRDIGDILTDSSCKSSESFGVSYNNKGLLSLEEIITVIDCQDRNGWENRFLYRLIITDYDEKNIQLLRRKKYEFITIHGDQEILSKYEFDKRENKYSRFGIGIDSLSIVLNSTAYQKVFFHGLKYLISIAKEQMPKIEEEVVEDPFVKKTSTLSKHGTKSESKIPLSEENGVFIVAVSFSESIFSKFILDSGAGDCTISSELEKKLIAKGIIKQKDYLDNGLYSLADGSIIENRRVVIPKIRVGNKTIYKVIVSVGLPGNPNLLGQSFLKKLDKWSIDNSNNYLIIK